MKNTVTKSFINKCLFFLNEVGHKYINATYGVTRFNDFIYISFQIWDANETKIIKSFVKTISNYISFEDMKSSLNKFIEENKELLLC